MLSLRSFHVILIAIAIMLAGGVGVWALTNRSPWLAGCSLVLGVLLIIYGAYFARRSQQVHLD
ncbi:MAG TPA: hypothetical protein VH583_24530 [Vicinamibacterales bacterium]|jgi:arginine exporter protein ArgO